MYLSAYSPKEASCPVLSQQSDLVLAVVDKSGEQEENDWPV
jgi:hypothetical protein